jgi:redox-sensitive bicupin YhaK (pirin superfamily)
MISVSDVPVRDLDGLPLRRALPVAGRRAVGPIVFFDHVGPVDVAAGTGVDVRPHPHIGLSTVSWLFDGAILHRDSLGHAVRLAPGEVNWMRAGRGIVHSERTPPAERANGHRLHLLQCWIAASDAQADADPAFVHLPASEVPRVLAPGIDLRVLAGAGFDRDPALPTDTPCVIAVLRLANRMRFEFRAEFSERALYVVSGRVNLAGQACAAQQFATLVDERTVYLDAIEPSVIVLLGGEPIGERELWWNFVAGSRAQIDAASERWARGDFPAVPGDDERMPLPPR